MGDLSKRYEGVFEFQRLLYSQYKMPKGADHTEALHDPNAIFDFFERLKDSKVDQWLYADIGEIVTLDFHSMERENQRLRLYASSGRDTEGFVSLSFVPQRLEMSIRRDPRKSCAALFLKPGTVVEEWVKDSSLEKLLQVRTAENYLLVYPTNSLLIKEYYRSQVLPDLGVAAYDSYDPGAVPFPNRQSGWVRAIIHRIEEKVIGKLKGSYCKRVSYVHGFTGRPARNSNGEVFHETGSPVVSFKMKHSREMVKGIEGHMRQLLDEFVPFDTYVFSQPVKPTSHHMRFSIMFELPEQPF